jgi:hypothetical protein
MWNQPSWQKVSQIQKLIYPYLECLNVQGGMGLWPHKRFVQAIVLTLISRTGCAIQCDTYN